MEALAKLIGSPQAKPENALPVPKKLVLREFEIKTPDHNPTGPAYEHPAKDKIDFNNPIDTIHNWEYGRCYFSNKNGEVGRIQSDGNFVPIKVNPADSAIVKILVNYENIVIRGFKFYDKEGKCVLETPDHN